MNHPRDYSDIIHLPHHVSQWHPRMKMIDRAAQFAPFAALTGHDEAIRETARLVDEKTELDESQKQIINMTLNDLQNRLNEHPEVNITYFQPDLKKSGGAYFNMTDRIKKIDEIKHFIVFESNLIIPFENIYDIEDTQHFSSFENMERDI